jgi:hypothetical protein
MRLIAVVVESPIKRGTLAMNCLLQDSRSEARNVLEL